MATPPLLCFIPCPFPFVLVWCSVEGGYGSSCGIPLSIPPCAGPPPVFPPFPTGCGSPGGPPCIGWGEGEGECDDCTRSPTSLKPRLPFSPAC